MPTFSLIALMLVFGALLLAAVAIGAWLVHAAKSNVSPLAPVRDAVRAVRGAFERQEKPEEEIKFPNPRM